MRFSLRFLLLCMFFLSFAGITYTQGETEVLPLNQDVLLNFTSNQAITVFEFETESATTLTLDVRYLGATFPFDVEIFQNDVSTGAGGAITEATNYAFELPNAGFYTILFYIQEGSGGRAVMNASFASAPKDGTWQIAYGTNETNCVDILTMDAVWLPADGSEVELIFSDPITPLDFHMAVASEELSEEPEFFETMITEDGHYEVVPGIQGAPYTYTYTIVDDETIQLDYLETLSLSDCELSVVVEITYVDPDEQDADSDATETPIIVDLSGWGVLGDAGETIIENNMICATDMQQGETWYFDAPQSFVDEVVNGYGKTLSFALKQDTTAGQFDDVDVLLVVGNGILLGYDLPENPALDFTTYHVSLTEDAGWFDVDGFMDASDPALFPQMLSDVTRVQIRGEFSENKDTGCLQSPMVTDSDSASAGSGSSNGGIDTTSNPTGNETNTTDSTNNTGISGEVLINGLPLQAGEWLATGTLGGVGCEDEELWHVSGAMETRTMILTISPEGIVDSGMSSPVTYLPTDLENQFIADNSASDSTPFRFYLDFTTSTTGMYRQYFVPGGNCTGAFAFDLEYIG